LTRYELQNERPSGKIYALQRWLGLRHRAASCVGDVIRHHRDAGLFISNTATAVLTAPVALTIAKDLGASPYPFAMTVALAASAAFMMPISSPVNTLVVRPGQYSFGDFVKLGVPFTIIVAIVSVLLIPIFLPFQ
jgi:hypothetical protein